MVAATGIVETDIPARLDRLPWGRFHSLVVAALEVTWMIAAGLSPGAGALPPSASRWRRWRGR